MLTPPLDVTEMRDLITTARELLQAIRVDPTSPPTKGSPALLAFDPFISRRLPNFMPVKAVELPHHDETWDMLDRFLRDYEELSVLLDSLHVTTWEVSDLSIQFSLVAHKTQGCRLSACVLSRTAGFSSLPPVVDTGRGKPRCHA